VRTTQVSGCLHANDTSQKADGARRAGSAAHALPPSKRTRKKEGNTSAHTAAQTGDGIECQVSGGGGVAAGKTVASSAAHSMIAHKTALQPGATEHQLEQLLQSKEPQATRLLQECSKLLGSDAVQQVAAGPQKLPRRMPLGRPTHALVTGTSYVPVQLLVKD
jgi:hypothetical protein